MTNWDAEQYLRFANERTQPSLDLAGRIAVPHPSRIVDLGCGPGNSTEILRRRWPEALVVGLDNSPEMIGAASARYPEGEWLLADVATWTAEAPFDIVFSNAALQWVPHHADLFPRLFAQLTSGGALAVQMPSHFHSTLHRPIFEVADDPQWRHLMEPARNAQTRESPFFYYDLLQPLAARVVIWETEYYHIVDGPGAIVEWFRGTALRPYLQVLEDDARRERFAAMLLERYTHYYPLRKDGRVLFPFRRLFIVAYRA